MAPLLHTSNPFLEAEARLGIASQNGRRTFRAEGTAMQRPWGKNELNILGNGQKALEAGMEHVGGEE